MIDFSGISLPFNAGELLSSGLQLLGVVSPFVLLGLTFVIVPLFIKLIQLAVYTHQDNKMNADKPRDQYTYGSSVKQYFSEDFLRRRR